MLLDHFDFTSIGMIITKHILSLWFDIIFLKQNEFVLMSISSLVLGLHLQCLAIELCLGAEWVFLYGIIRDLAPGACI